MTKHIRIAVPDVISPSYFPAEAAVDLGCFNALGIDAELTLICPVERAYEAMRDGEVDFVAGSAHSALAAFPQWKDVKLVCAQSQGMYWFLVMRSDLGLKRGEVEGVRGRRIGAAPWVGKGLQRLLMVEGIDPENDVRIAPTRGSLAIDVNFGVAAVRAMESGEVDGFWANGMGAEIALRSGVGTVVLDVRRGDGPAEAFNYTMATVAATEQFIRKEPELAEGAARAIAAANEILSDDVTRAREVAIKRFPDQADIIVDLIKRDLPFYQTRLTPEFVQGMNQFSMDIGILDKSVSYEDVVACEFQEVWT